MGRKKLLKKQRKHKLTVVRLMSEDLRHIKFFMEVHKIDGSPGTFLRNFFYAATQRRTAWHSIIKKMKMEEAKN